MINQKAFSRIIHTDFSDGTLQGWIPQYVNAEDVQVVDNPDGLGKCLRLHININENFEDIIGTESTAPRAAIYLSHYSDPFFKFTKDYEYVTKFKTFIPLDFQIEEYPNILAFYDIHPIEGTPDSGISPNSLNIDGLNYKWCNDVTVSYNDHIQKIFSVGNISNDLGKWVEWIVYYKPSFSTGGILRVWKDEQLITEFKGYTCYKTVDTYQKFQVYKPLWKTNPTSVSDIVMYFSDISIHRRKL